MFTAELVLQGDRSSMKDHMAKSQNNHLTLTVKRNSSLEQQVAKLSESVQGKDQTVARLEERCSQFERLLEDLTMRMTILERKSEGYAQLKGRLNAVVDAEPVTAQPPGEVSIRMI